MPVDHKHRLYLENIDTWRQCRAVLDGARAVKGDDIATDLLPRLSGHPSADSDAYKNYLAMAHFFPGASRALAGFVGLMNEDEAIITAPPAMKDFLEDVTANGAPLRAQDFIAGAVLDVSKTGRYGIYTDFPGRIDGTETPNARDFERLGLRPRWRLYVAEDIWDWHETRVGGRKVLAYVLLHEETEVYAPTPKDEFVWEEVEQLRLLDRAFPPLDAEVGSLPEEALPPQGDGMVYRARIFRQDENENWVQSGPAVFPRIDGKFMTEIPFDFGGSRTPDASVDKPPLEDAVVVNIGHYRNSAAHEHGLLFTANPMGYLFGFDAERELPPVMGADGVATAAATPRIAWKMGSSEMLVLKNENAKVGMLSAKADDLSAIREAMAVKRDELVAVVGRIIAQEKKAAEAARTEEIRREGEKGALTTICRSVEATFLRALKRAQAWIPDAAGKVEITLPTEFFEEGLTPAEAEQLADLWLKYGLIAKSDVRALLRKTRFIGQDRTDAQIDSELARDPIPSAPSALTVGLGLPGSAPPAAGAVSGQQPPPPPGGGGGGAKPPGTVVNAPPRG